MKQEVTQPKQSYEKPRIEVLGTFAGLTLGGKTSGISDSALRLSVAVRARRHRLRIPPELTAVETTVGFPSGGRARSTRRLEQIRLDPLEALANSIERVVTYGPPAVAFSGGRDSSLLLAVAARVCRRAGVEPPLPITLCMPSQFSESEEHEWQERVLDHLQIDRWHRIPITGELDLVGPYARRHLSARRLAVPRQRARGRSDARGGGRPLSHLGAGWR